MRNWLLGDLRGFLVVAEELHFGRAAERIGVAQPVLSRRIRRFEGAVGAVLFERSSRMVALTPAGAALRDEAGRMLGRLDAAIGSAAQHGPAGAAPLRVGFVSAAQGLLPRVLEQWRRELEGTVQLVRATSAQQLDMLREDRIDLGFLRPPVSPGALALATIRQEGMIAVLPPGHPLAARASLRLADLAGERWVRHGPVLGTGFQQRMEERLRQENIPMSFGVEANDTPSVMMLAAAGYGVALLPDSNRLLAPPGTACRQLADIRPFVRLAIARRRDDPQPRVLAAMAIALAAARGMEDAEAPALQGRTAGVSTARPRARPAR
ncbi:LysR family transcriptional regulator [Allostella vacuolata]|nr:LysR family transcriptional regulator [Stella vacuolata]